MFAFMEESGREQRKDRLFTAAYPQSQTEVAVGHQFLFYISQFTNVLMRYSRIGEVIT
jgi:hypothetical protein